jgi:hypothetical protein
MEDLELLCNSTDFCLTVNYCVIVLIIMSLDKYFKRKSLEDEESIILN